jgi:transposase
VGGVFVSAHEQLILEIVCKVEAGKILRPEAQMILQVTARTFRRYLKDYRKDGLGFVRHGNRRRSPINKLPDELKIKVQNLMKGTSSNLPTFSI